MQESEYGKNISGFPFQKLLKNSSIIFYQRKIEDTFPLLYISSNVKELLGYKDEFFIAGKGAWFQKVHQKDRDKLRSAYRQIAETGYQEVEFRFKHKKGHYLWFRDEINYVDDKTVVGSCIDITDEKEAENKLRDLNQTLEERIKERTSKLSTANRKLKKQVQYRNKAEDQLRDQHERLRMQQLAIDNLNDMVVVTKSRKEDPLNSRIIFVNKAFEKFTGYQAEEVIGRKPTFLHGPKTSQDVLNRINEKIGNHGSLREEFINYKKDGSPYWAELDMAPFPTEGDDFEYWVGINRDITQRKKAEQKLEESERRYRAFAELSFDAIFDLALDGTIQNCNKRASELFGYDQDELIGMSSRELMPEEYRSSQPDIISTDTTTGDEAWERTYKKKDGTLFPTEIHTQLFNFDGEKRLIAYVRDNTAHKKYENAIRKSLKEKETLLAEVHHRVKNNLAIISGLLEMQVFNTEDEQLLGKLKESQSRILSIAMVHEKLYSSESFSEIAINKYIDDLLGMIIGSMGDKKNIRIEKDMEAIFLTMEQAVPCGLLLNELITNCFKHGFQKVDSGVIKIAIKKQQGQVLLSIKDNGTGLPQDFDVESQASLGMTLITTLVKQLDGELNVTSNGGSCFEIAFEIKSAP